MCVVIDSKVSSLKQRKQKILSIIKHMQQLSIEIDGREDVISSSESCYYNEVVGRLKKNKFVIDCVLQRKVFQVFKVKIFLNHI